MKNNTLQTYETANTMRGFLKCMFDYINKKSKRVKILVSNTTYEKVSILKKIIHSLVLLRVFDYLGIFQIIDYKSQDTRVYGALSYNRFTTGRKPYYIILENPYALVHYSDTRMRHMLTKKKLDSCFSDKNLNGIICICKACESTIRKIYEIPERINIYQAYPIIPNQKFSTRNADAINCLYVSSEFWMKGGREILDAFSLVRSSNRIQGINLTIVTPIHKLDNRTIEEINNLGINLVDYKLSKHELNEYYKKSHILLHPTKMDSFPLVVLESLKFGCAYIGTKPYAVGEMIINGYNGFTTNSIYSPWNNDNTFNHSRHAHLSRICRSQEVDMALVKFIFDKLVYFYENKDKLASFCENSHIIANKTVFSDKKLLREWEEILNTNKGTI